MSLNIKNPRVHTLAREAARRTGQSQTSVIEEALVRLLADLEPETDHLAERAARLDDVFALIKAEVTDADRAAMQAVEDDLYDDQGLPR